MERRRKKKRGFFIAFEGGEGSGKSSQISSLSRYLRKAHLPVVVSCEPGGTRIGRGIRRLLLSPRFKEMNPRTELLLYQADRAQHVEQVILPALQGGKIVISDRHADSSTVYQGICRKMGMRRTAWLNDCATNKLHPDLVILLDVPVEVGLRRIRGRRGLDRLEQETRNFHQKVRRGFLTLARKRGKRYAIIDGTQSMAEVSHSIRTVVERKLRRRGIWKQK